MIPGEGRAPTSTPHFISLLLEPQTKCLMFVLKFQLYLVSSCVLKWWFPSRVEKELRSWVQGIVPLEGGEGAPLGSWGGGRVSPLGSWGGGLLHQPLKSEPRVCKGSVLCLLLLRDPHFIPTKPGEGGTNSTPNF